MTSNANREGFVVMAIRIVDGNDEPKDGISIALSAETAENFRAFLADSNIGMTDFSPLYHDIVEALEEIDVPIGTGTYVNESILFREIL